MSFLDKIFSPTEVETKSTSDNWGYMPQFMRNEVTGDHKRRVGLLNRADKVSRNMMRPQRLAGLTDMEKGANQMIQQDYQESEDRSNEMLAGLDGGFEDQYTDDVVNTTLAGMDRQAQREMLARDSQAASLGGTSNTRAAVGNAVASQLSGMNRAEMEAKLRSDAAKFGAEMGLSETELADSINAGMFDRGIKAGGVKGMLGETKRGIRDKNREFKRTAGKDSLSWLADIQTGTQPNYQGWVNQTTGVTPGPSPLQTAAGVISAL